MSDVISLVDMKGQSGAFVVERIEQVLEQAKAGELENVAVVAVGKDGSVRTGWANGDCVFSMVGGLESLKRDMMTVHVEKEDE